MDRVRRGEQEVDHHIPDTLWQADSYIETSRPSDRDRVSEAEYAGDRGSGSVQGD
jgi:hypothetical protein